jgi:hypothetical protein
MRRAVPTAPPPRVSRGGHARSPPRDGRRTADPVACPDGEEGRRPGRADEGALGRPRLRRIAVEDHLGHDAHGGHSVGQAVVEPHHERHAPVLERAHEVDPP